MANSFDNTFEIEHPLDRRAREFGRRLQRVIDEFHAQGASHGPEREAAADKKLRSFNSKRNCHQDHDGIGELAADLEILMLTLERWLARVDRLSDLRGSGPPSGD
jgi:hypothetical protein